MDCRSLHLYRSSLVALLALSALTAACTSAPKPRELVELDVMWNDPETRKVREVPGAERYYREAYAFRQRAEDAFQAGSHEQAIEYARWSVLRYRTAEAVSRQRDAKQRLDAANARVGQVNPELTAANQERNKLAEQIALLERQVAVARREKIERDRRAQPAVIASQPVDDAARARAADDKIAMLEQARQRAVDAGAPQHAQAQFNRADNIYKSVKTLRQNVPPPYDAIIASSDSAIATFGEAAQAAKPGFKEAQAKADPVARRRELAQKAAAIMGDPYVIQEATAVRIIAPRSYAPRSGELSETGRKYVEALVKLANTYDEMSVSLEVHTSRGDATENLAISQIRARQLADAFTTQGVKRDRVTSRGVGQEGVRFPDDISMNERIEVVFRTP